MVRRYSIILVTFLCSICASQGSASISGAFLASRLAASVNDFDKSATYTVDMISKGNKQTEIYNDALLFLVAAGNFEKAYSLANTMKKLEIQSPALGLTLVIGKIKEKQFNRALELMVEFGDQLPNVLKTSIKGWIHVEKGNLDPAMREFSSFKDSELSFDLGSYYSSIAYAQLGEYSKALEMIRGKMKNLKVLGESYKIFRSNVLYLSGDVTSALSLLGDDIGSSSDNLTLKKLYENMKERKTVILDIFKTPKTGIADTLILFAGGGDREVNQNLIEIFYCQLAHYVSGNESRFNIRLAQALADSNLIDEAINTLMLVEKSHLFHPKSELMLAELLTESSREELAIKHLRHLIDNGTGSFEVYEALGNAYRHRENFELAEIAYSDALAANIHSDFENKKLWLIYFFRGIAREQLDNYEQSMIDLRKALEFVPEQPQVLNYLGYMLIERRENLDEALGMIKLAVKQSPESGYIVDSLAWGLYQLGRYYDAVVPMEKAIELEPEDPIVNDHYGDVLWKVGRKRESYFQWRRALLFEPDEELNSKIQEKLKEGLIDSFGN
ncbi:MAG: hypothetical protein P8L82_05570 [Paracoccaceae bacterium]|nr:hypothetical protein [Paracoccaceae bacterium]